MEGSISPNVENTYVRNVVVRSGTSLRVQGTMRFLYGATLTVEPGAYLLIDGGNIYTGRLIPMHGSTFVVDNGGTYVPPYNTKFDVPIGVVANILRGTIY